MTDPKPPVYDARLENLDASPVNPQRIGRFVKVVRIPRPRMNAGTWWQLTDGRGAFWDVRPDRLRLVPVTGQARETLVARLRTVIEWVSERDHSRAIELDHVVHAIEQLAAGDTVQAPALHATTDWPARFHAAASVARHREWDGTAHLLDEVAENLQHCEGDDADVPDVIGRALLGTDTTTGGAA